MTPMQQGLGPGREPGGHGPGGAHSLLLLPALIESMSAGSAQTTNAESLAARASHVRLIGAVRC
jgi:hypothetical protein